MLPLSSPAAMASHKAAIVTLRDLREASAFARPITRSHHADTKTMGGVQRFYGELNVMFSSDDEHSSGTRR